MAVSQQVADQGPVIGYALSPLAIADAGGLDDGTVVTHDIDQADKPVVQNGEFLPPQFIRCGRLLHRRLLM